MILKPLIKCGVEDAKNPKNQKENLATMFLCTQPHPDTPPHVDQSTVTRRLVDAQMRCTMHLDFGGLNINTSFYTTLPDLLSVS